MFDIHNSPPPAWAADPSWLKKPRGGRRLNGKDATHLDTSARKHALHRNKISKRICSHAVLWTPPCGTVPHLPSRLASPNSPHYSISKDKKHSRLIRTYTNRHASSPLRKSIILSTSLVRGRLGALAFGIRRGAAPPGNREQINMQEVSRHHFEKTYNPCIAYAGQVRTTDDSEEQREEIGGASQGEISCSYCP